MTVIDLIIKLQQLPPNMQVMLDVSKQSGNLFKFADVVNIEEVTPEGHNEIILISPYEFDEEENLN